MSVKRLLLLGASPAMHEVLVSALAETHAVVRSVGIERELMSPICSTSRVSMLLGDMGDLDAVVSLFGCGLANWPAGSPSNTRSGSGLIAQVNVLRFALPFLADGCHVVFTSGDAADGYEADRIKWVESFARQAETLLLRGIRVGVVRVPPLESQAFGADHQNRFVRACAIALAAPHWGGVIDTSPNRATWSSISAVSGVQVLAPMSTSAPDPAASEPPERISAACSLRMARSEDDALLYRLACAGDGLVDETALNLALESERRRAKFDQDRSHAAISVIEVDGLRVGSLWIDLEASHVELIALHLRRGWESFGIQLRVLRRLIDEARSRGSSVRFRIPLWQRETIEAARDCDFDLVDRSQGHANMTWLDPAARQLRHRFGNGALGHGNSRSHESNSA